MFARNGYAEQIELIRGWSTQVVLPERANVLVAELVGLDPFDELIIELTTDAKARLLDEHSRLIPQRMQIHAALDDLPDQRGASVRFVPALLDRWQTLYGFDFSALNDTSPQSLSVHLTTAESKQLRRLSDPVVVNEVDFQGTLTSRVTAEAILTVRRPGRVAGCLLFFELQLAAGVTLSTDPESSEETNHWGNRVVLLTETFEATEGEQFRLKLDRMEGTYAVRCERIK